MAIRRQISANQRLARQCQQKHRQQQARDQICQARAEMTSEQLENRREGERRARDELTQEQLEFRQQQDRDQHRRVTAAEGVQITNEVNGRGETFSIDMIGRPTTNQLEDFELDEDKSLLLFYENSHDHVADLIQELDDCEIGEGWRWQPLSKRCVCH